MGCPPVRGLSYVQVAKHGINIFTTYISVDLAHHDIFRAKNGKGGKKAYTGYRVGELYCLYNNINWSK